jgi:Zn-dependent peptidase ImmA (M78 family)
MTDKKNIIRYPSIFKQDIFVTLIFKENSEYENVKKLFDLYGFGFYSPDYKTIIIDGEIFQESELDIDDLRFIEAHEISHLLLNHTGDKNDSDEMDADLGAYILLKRNNLSTKRLIDVFFERHGINFSEELLVKVNNLL